MSSMHGSNNPAFRHGGVGTRTYIIWASMKSRCYCPSDTNYRKYGAKGVTVCTRWHDFINFVEDMGEAPDGLTLDRTENSDGYSKDNCRWATPVTQAVNRRTTRFITYNGETRCLKHWANELGMPYLKLYKRLGRGWPIEKAFATEASC